MSDRAKKPFGSDVSSATVLFNPNELMSAAMAETKEFLVTLRGGQLGAKIELDRRRPITVGRAISNDIYIDDNTVSGTHCRFYFAQNMWVLEDLNSTNGTYVQGQSIQRCALRDGDLIKVGQTIYKFLSTLNVETAYYEEIYRMAIFDGLTQIHNRRYLEEFIERELSRCRRHGRPMALLLFDVDKFKSINDTYGHLAGDHVLRTMAAQISTRIRREELFARYAGDEFVVVLPESHVVEAAILGESIRSLVEECDFTFDNQPLRASISVGAAEVRPDITTPAQLIAAADAALYRAKQQGRNTVSC